MCSRFAVLLKIKDRLPKKQAARHTLLSHSPSLALAIGTFDLDFQAARAYDEWSALLGKNPVKGTNLAQDAEWIVPRDEAATSSHFDAVFPQTESRPASRVFAARGVVLYSSFCNMYFKFI